MSGLDCLGDGGEGDSGREIVEERRRKGWWKCGRGKKGVRGD